MIFRAWLVITLFFLTSQFAYAGPLESCTEFTKYGVPENDGDLLCRKGYLLAHDPYYLNTDAKPVTIRTAQIMAIDILQHP